MTINGEHFFLPIECEVVEDKVLETIFRHMYFTMHDYDLKLNYDSRHNSVFITILVNIKGIGVTCVIITQEE